MKSFIVRMRRTIIEDWFVDAVNLQRAWEKAANWDDLTDPIEIEQEDWEVLKVVENN